MVEKARWRSTRSGSLSALYTAITLAAIAPGAASYVAGAGTLWIIATTLLGGGTAIAAARLASQRAERQLGPLSFAMGQVLNGEPGALANLATIDVGGRSNDFRDLYRVTAAVGDALTTLVLAATGATRTLKARSSEILGVSDTMATNAETSAEEASIAAGTADEVARNVVAVATGVDELARTIQEVARHAVDASTIAFHAAEDASRAQAVVAELADACQRVDVVVRLIERAAHQTHLLALNAAIEAAAAGEAGAGFAVVAHEVKQLSVETSRATKTADESVDAIRTGSSDAAEAMGTVVVTIDQVSANQVAIAAAVEEQTAVTNDLGRVANMVALSVQRIADSVASLAAEGRVIAYAGGQAAAAATELASVGDDVRSALQLFGISTIATTESLSVVEKTQASAVGGVTTVPNSAFGEGLFEWQFSGHWEHSRGNLEGDDPNSYSGFPADTATLRFQGERVRLYCVKGPNHGIVSLSIDGGDAVDCDQYSPTRGTNELLWTSAPLAAGEHVLTVRVSGRKNVQSKYVWITLQKAECFNA